MDIVKINPFWLIIGYAVLTRIHLIVLEKHRKKLEDDLKTHEGDESETLKAFINYTTKLAKINENHLSEFFLFSLIALIVVFQYYK